MGGGVDGKGCCETKRAGRSMRGGEQTNTHSHPHRFSHSNSLFCSLSHSVAVSAPHASRYRPVMYALPSHILYFSSISLALWLTKAARVRAHTGQSIRAQARALNAPTRNRFYLLACAVRRRRRCCVCPFVVVVGEGRPHRRRQRRRISDADRVHTLLCTHTHTPTHPSTSTFFAMPPQCCAEWRARCARHTERPTVEVAVVEWAGW